MPLWLWFARVVFVRLRLFSRCVATGACVSSATRRSMMTRGGAWHQRPTYDPPREGALPLHDNSVEDSFHSCGTRGLCAADRLFPKRGVRVPAPPDRKTPEIRSVCAFRNEQDALESRDPRWWEPWARARERGCDYDETATLERAILSSTRHVFFCRPPRDLQDRHARSAARAPRLSLSLSLFLSLASSVGEQVSDDDRWCSEEPTETRARVCSTVRSPNRASETTE